MRPKLLICAVLLAAVASAQQINPAPNRKPGEGEGPFDRLVIRGVTVIDGTGAQPRGPMVQKQTTKGADSIGPGSIR